MLTWAQASVIYDLPEENISIKIPLDIDSKRQSMIDYIWGTYGWPAKRVPDEVTVDLANTFYDQIKTPEGNLSRIDRYTIKMEHDFVAFVDHFIPVSGNGKLFIYHAGHGYGYQWEDYSPNGNYQGAGLVIPDLLKLGYSVLAISMPLQGQPVPATPPAEGELDWIQYNSLGHIQMFQYLQHPYSYYFDPITISLNYIEDTYDYSDIYMTGLSGGGWTTAVYSALDERIRFSFPVAGSVPLYLRKGKEGYGDAEQGDDYNGLFGIANYKEMYVMASYGENRGQLQINNKYDNCCFYDDVRNLLWVDTVKQKIDELGAGRYNFFLEDSTRTHRISPLAYSEIKKFISYYEGNDSVPLINSTQRTDTLYEGGSTSFEIHARAENVSYYWQVKVNDDEGFTHIKDTVHYRGVHSAILSIDNVTADMDRYIYRCMVTGENVPTTTSYALTLRVSEHFGLLESPETERVCSNMPISFTVGTTSDKLLFQWQVDNGNGFKDIPASELYEGQLTDSLVIRKVDVNMDGYAFRCAVANSTGLIIFSNPTTLFVTRSPEADFTGLQSLISQCDEPVTLVPTSKGGLFGGNGVSGTSFDPSRAELGNQEITYTVTQSGCTTSASQSTLVYACQQESQYLYNLVATPNPSSGVVSVTFQTVRAALIRLSVYSSQGRLINSAPYNTEAGFNSYTLDLTMESRGLYLVVLLVEGESNLQRIVIN